MATNATPIALEVIDTDKPLCDVEKLMRNKSHGGTLGLVYTHELTTDEAMTVAETLEEFSVVAKSAETGGDKPYAGFLADIFLGLVPRKMARTLGYTADRIKEDASLAGETVNKGVKTVRKRYRVECRADEPRIIICPRQTFTKSLIHRDSVKLLCEYIKNNNGLKSESARRYTRAG